MKISSSISLARRDWKHACHGLHAILGIPEPLSHYSFVAAACGRQCLPTCITVCSLEIWNAQCSADKKLALSALARAVQV